MVCRIKFKTEKENEKRILKNVRIYSG